MKQTGFEEKNSGVETQKNRGGYFFKRQVERTEAVVCKAINICGVAEAVKAKT